LTISWKFGSPGTIAKPIISTATRPSRPSASASPPNGNEASTDAAVMPSTSAWLRL
jgi:hypothetical protein